MFTNEEFENIKSEYQKGNIKIDVELSNGRKFLVDILKDPTCTFWGATFILIMIISFFISIYSLGVIWGILYAIIFCILYNVYMGICSLHITTKQTIFYIACILCFVSLILELKLAILGVFTCFSFIFIYLFYDYILTKILKEALKSNEIFNILLEYNVIKLFK